MSEAGPTRKEAEKWSWDVILILIGMMLIGFYYTSRTGFFDREQERMPSVVQSARSINLLMFSYANDNGGKYPTGKSSTEVFQKLIDGDYCTDPEIFYFPMDGKTKPTSKTLKPENVCWDVTASLTGKDSDFVPTVFATGYKMTYAPGGNAVSLKAEMVETTGLPVAYKSNSAVFIKGGGIFDGVVRNVISKDFDPAGKTYQQLTPEGSLRP